MTNGLVCHSSDLIVLVGILNWPGQNFDISATTTDILATKTEILVTKTDILVTKTDILVT